MTTTPYYITVCDLCICLPVCRNKTHTNMIYQCSILQNKIRRISHVIKFRCAILDSDTNFTMDTFHPGHIRIAVHSYYIATISKKEFSEYDY